MSGVLLSRWHIKFIQILRVMASKIKLSPKFIFILFFFYTAVISMLASNLMDCTVLWCLHLSILFVFGLSISDVVWNPKTCNNLLLASYIGMRHQSECMRASVPWETVKKPGHLMCSYCGAHLYPFFFFSDDYIQLQVMYKARLREVEKLSSELESLKQSSRVEISSLNAQLASLQGLHYLSCGCPF